MQIRYIGLSNETPYGVMKFIQVTEKFACYPKIVSLQVLSLASRQLIPLFLFYSNNGTLALNP